MDSKHPPRTAGDMFLYVLNGGLAAIIMSLVMDEIRDGRPRYITVPIAALLFLVFGAPGTLAIVWHRRRKGGERP